MSRRPAIDATCKQCRTRQRSESMTVGELSRRTGVPVKALRHYADTGLVYTVGRSSGGYRLFDEDAFWCLEWIDTLRGLGLTLVEIRELAQAHRGGPIGPMLAERLAAVRARTEERIVALKETLDRVNSFEAEHEAELRNTAADPLWSDNPRESIR